jgi:COP9 signalosome complex subunit 2
MTDLVEAYQRNEIHRYESILEKNKADILSDPFIREHIDEVTRNIRTEALLKLIAPFTRFTLDFIARQLRISVPEVQEILGFLILDKKIRGKINQENGTVQIESNVDAERMHAMKEWSSALERLSTTLFNDGEGFKSEDNTHLGGSQSSVIFETRR